MARTALALLLVGLAAALFAANAAAQNPTAEKIREIFVPFEDLNVILDSDTHRVFLTRKEYEELVAKAAARPLTRPPLAAAVIAAQYSGRLEDGRAVIDGTLHIDVLEEGVFALPLELGGVGIRSASLDGRPAPLGRNEHGHVVLFVQGAGRHVLSLALTSALSTTAATQTLQATLPVTSATKLELAIPGNVEVRAGASTIARTYDEPTNTTRLELLPQRGAASIVLSLNNKTLKEQRVAIAKSVLVTEVTQGYERLHATVSHHVLHGAVDRLRFELPAGFEVTQVSATQLARWEVKKDVMPPVLEAVLREPTSEPIVLQVAATRSPPVLEKWSLPRLAPLDVAGQVAVIGLLVEDRLDPQRIAASGLLPVDADTLAAAIPASVFQAEPGAPVVRQAVSYYAPSGGYSLSAEFIRPPAELRVASSGLLTLADKELRYSGSLVLMPQAEDLFELLLNVPSGWQVTEVARADGTPLAWERYEARLPMGGAAAGTRLRAKIPGGIKAGQQLGVRFLAVWAPAGWLADWQTQTIEFPQFTVEGATRDSGPLGVNVVDDLSVRPDRAEGVVPLSDAERQELSAGSQQLSLAYRFESRPFALSLVAERIAPSLTADVFCYLALDADHLDAAYELHYAVRDARTQQVEFSLPEKTPAEVAIQGLAGTTVKEYGSAVQDGRRRWTVQLAERQAGEVRLLVTFQQRFDKAEPKGLRLPLAQAEGVDYQSVMVGVEGTNDLDIEVTDHPREIDVGEIQGDVHYTITRRLIGAYGYVGLEGDANQVVVDVVRREPYGLPAALVQRAELVTRVSQSGRSQSVARYDLKTKATLIEIQLPAASRLWTVFLDGQPARPQNTRQNDRDRLLLTLPAQTQATARRLQIVYESDQPPLATSASIEADAPAILLHVKGEDQPVAIPQVELHWTLVLPSGYEVRRERGSVFTEELPPRQLAAVKAGKWLWALLNRPVLPQVYLARQLAPGDSVHTPAYRYKSSAAGEAEIVMDDAGSMRHVERRDIARSLEEAKSEPAPGRDAASAERLPEPTREDKLAQTEGQLALQPPTTGAPSPLAAASDQSAAKAPPPQEPAPAQDAAGKGSAVLGKGRWAEQGLAGLLIDIQEDPYAPATIFRSLGVAPRLRAVAVERRRSDAAAWGLAMLVFLVGVGMTHQPARQRWSFVVVVLLAATVPLLATRQLDEFGQVFDCVFYAGALLIPYYLVASPALAAWRWLAPRASGWLADKPRPAAVRAAALIAVLGIVLAAENASAQVLPIEVKNIRDLLPILDPGGTVNVPKDAIIIPYDPDKPEGLAEAVRVLVPYEKYVELWNRANPDKKLTDKPPPAPFALAGAGYQATLTDAGELVITGKMEIEVFGDKPVAIPLTLVGGVLARATLDGQPARLMSVQPQQQVDNAPAAQPPAQPAPNATPPGAPHEAVLLLHAEGKGRKTLELAIRMGLSRQGGWRIVSGRLPAAPATALTLTIPQEQTEVRLSGLPDRGRFESAKANDTVQTALAADGSLALQWRPKVTEGMVDQSLTAHSAAVIDVREDAVRLVWQVRLEFGRGTRDSFRFSVPLGYLVEQVTGENVLGFALKEENGRQSVDVTLMKGAAGSETLVLHLSRRGVVGQGELAQFAAPDVRVEAAALHQGEMAIRRSARLDLRSVTVADLSRAEADGATAAVVQMADAAETSFLPLAPFASYRFVREGFKLTLAAQPPPRETTAHVRAIVRAGERDSSLDAAIVYRVQGEPLYRARVYLPDGFELARLSPAGLEWAVTAETVEVAGVQSSRQLLTVHLPRGQSGEFTLAILGKLPPRTQANEVVAPQLEVLDVPRQEGEIVFLPEPDTDIEPTQLTHCERVSAMETFYWLQEEQKRLAKYAIRYRSTQYAATLRLLPRTPRITAVTLTNVRITPRAIEETLSFHFRVENAGVRELSVILPEYLRKGRLPPQLATQVQQKIVEPAVDADGNPRPGLIRVRFVLPEHRRGEIRLGLLYDRLLAGDQQTAAIPEVTIGRMHQRFLLVENVGRDEVLVEATQGIESVVQGQQAYRDIQAILPGAKFTQAYLVSANAVAPQLSFRLQSRQRQEQPGATIGLARTWLVVDAFGAYRGQVEFNIRNETEQYLQVQLPPSAQLWTAMVRGEPAKPVEAEPKQAGLVRIPLVKAAQGEGDYQVVLKYGGHLGTFGELSRVGFPLVKARNVEQSQVRLYLPRSQKWLAFGGTMTLVTDEAELERGYQSYFYKQVEEMKRLVAGADDYRRSRALNNLKQLAIAHAEKKSRLGAQAQDELVLRNDQILAEAQQLAQEQESRQQERFADDNRAQLYGLWGRQEQERSKNVVGSLRSNFDAAGAVQDPMRPADKPSVNADWFAKNSLDNREARPAGRSDEPAKGESVNGPVLQGRVVLGKKQAGAEADEKLKVELQDFGAMPSDKDAQMAQRENEAGGKELAGRGAVEQQNLRSYRQKLEQKLQQQQQLEQLERFREVDGAQAGTPAPESPLNLSQIVPGEGAGNVGGGGFGGGMMPGSMLPADGPGIAPALAGMASLDVQIPYDGAEYLFTTPRGDVQITARPISNWLVSRLWGIAGLIAVVALAWGLTRPALVRLYAKVAVSIWLPVALIAVGVVGCSFGFIPTGAVILLAIGVGMLVRRWILGSPAAASA
jgi:hypothetical protein